MAAVTCYLIRIVRKIFVTFPFDDDLHDGNKFHSLIPSSKCIPQTYIFRHMLPIDENVGKTINITSKVQRDDRDGQAFLFLVTFFTSVYSEGQVCVCMCVCVFILLSILN